MALHHALGSGSVRLVVFERAFGAGLFALLACGSPAPEHAIDTPAKAVSHAPAPRCTVSSAPPIPLSPPRAEEISVEQLAALLPRHPIVVGFDVDDTLVFSAPAFNALEPSYEPNVIRPKDFTTLNAEQKDQYHAFWNELNEHLDDRSIPKKIGKVLLDLHIARKDDIHVVSRRQATVPASDAVDRRLERFFEIKLAHPIVQTNLTDKTHFLCERGIDLYYGDSDSDIAAAVAAGAIPVRVKRAANSYAKDVPHNGQLGEVVLAGSDE